MKGFKKTLCILLALSLFLMSASPTYAGTDDKAKLTEADTTQTPESDITKMPKSDVAQTSESDTTETPESDTTETPESDTTETPEPDTTETPEPDTTETPEPDTTETPEPDTTETPESDTTETTEPDTTETPESDTTETPESDATETPESDATETPESDITQTPESDTTQTPESDTTETEETQPLKTQRRSLSGNTIDLTGIISASIDYQKETVTVTLNTSVLEGNPEVDKSKIQLVFNSYTGDHSTASGIFTSSNSYTANLEEFGLPAASGQTTRGYLNITVQCDDSTYEESKVELTGLIRPSVSQPQGITVTKIYDTFTWTAKLDEYKIALSLQGESSPTIFDDNDDGTITGLQEGTNYTIYFQLRATDTAFHAAWVSRPGVLSTSTRTRISVTSTLTDSDLEWRPKSASGLVTLTTIQKSLQVTNASGTDITGDFYYSTYWNIKVTDSKGNVDYDSTTGMTFPVLDADTYTVTVSLQSASVADNYRFDQDSFNFTIKQLDLSTATLVKCTGSIIYTGQTLYPTPVYYNYSTSPISADEYTFEPVEGVDYINAGTKKQVKIKGNGINVIGEKTLTYTISKKTISSIDWPDIIHKEGDGFTYDLVYGQTLADVELTSTTDKYGNSFQWTYNYTPNAGTADYSLSYKYTSNFSINTTRVPTRKSYSITTIAKSLEDTSITADDIADLTYTGAEIKPEVTVHDGDKTLVEGTDYNVTYSNNEYVGTAKVTIEGIGNYSGSIEKTFQIAVRDISAEGVTVDEIAEQTYTGAELKPEVTVRDGDRLLTEGTDYEVTYSSNINAGTATVTISGIGNYTGTATKQFKIAAQNADEGLRVEGIADQTYTGAEIRPEVTVYDGDKLLAEETDYTVTYSNNKNVGTATVTVTGNGNYSGSVTAAFTIAARNISAEGVTVDEIASQTYNGEEIRPEVTVRDGEVLLAEGTDYNVTYANNKNVGTATVTIIGIGNYSESVTTEFKITARNISAEGVTVDEIGVRTYTGKEIRPEVTVRDGEVLLAEGTDYNVTYANNKNVGTATVTIEGIGNYSGSVTTMFEICAWSISETGLTVDEIASQTYTGEEIRPEVTVRDGDKILAEGTDYNVTYSNNKNVGTATVTITGNGNYSGSVTKAFTIVARNIFAEGVTVDEIASQIYTGEEIKPEVTVRDGDVLLVEGTDYNVTYANNKNVGTATVTITGIGNYSESVTKAFTIVARNISAEGVTVDEIGVRTYTGKEIRPEVTVRDGDKLLAKGTDYDVTYADNKNVGMATVTITGIGNYSGNVTKAFTIVARNISAEGVTVDEIAEQTYTGAELKPEVTVRDGDKLLAKGTDYDVIYADNKNVGMATVTITGIGNYSGSVTTGFEITARNISETGLTVDEIAEQTYTGAELKPEVTVRDGDKLLAEGTDYKVTYANNKNVGTATVTITGTGNYSGSVTTTFEIAAAPPQNEEENKPAESESNSGKPAESESNNGKPAESESNNGKPVESESNSGKTAKSAPDNSKPAVPARDDSEVADRLAAGEMVEGLVTDRDIVSKAYLPTTETKLDEETEEVVKCTLVFTADSVRNAEGEPVYRDGEILYEQRNLHLSQSLLKALAKRNYTHIRFVVKDAALEWEIADMTGEDNVIRLAPMEEAELSETEQNAIDKEELLSGYYRVRLTAVSEGKVIDVTGEIPSLTVCFDADTIRELSQEETAQCLQVPSDEELECVAGDAEYVEEKEHARYEAILAQSGLAVLILR